MQSLRRLVLRLKRHTDFMRKTPHSVHTALCCDSIKMGISIQTNTPKPLAGLTHESLLRIWPIIMPFSLITPCSDSKAY